MKKDARFFLACLILLFWVASSSPALCQQEQLLQEGIRQYSEENYEEAIEIFQRLRATGFESSQLSFFLGISYKQAGDFDAALQPLLASAAAKPPVKEAAVELAEIFSRLDHPEEAKKWLAISEANGTFPAKTAYLRGTILVREGKLTEAVEAFEKAGRLDASYRQIADYQIGLIHLANREYDMARQRLKAVVTQDPLSDLASYARRYQDIAEERRYTERPLRITLGLMGQYDTNMLQEPNPSTGAPDLGEERSLAMISSFRLDYLPVFTGPWLFNAGFAVGNTLHQKNSTSHDTITNTIYAAPGYNFGRFAVNLSANYTHALRRDPSYKAYYDGYSVGPLFRFLLSQNHLIEVYGAYTNDHYYGEPILPEEDQNTSGLDSYVGWIWLFQNGGMANIKYGYADQKADGENWSYYGHRLSANVIFPLMKEVRGQLGSEAFFQIYRNEHTIYDVKRRDKTYSAMAGLIWDVHRYVSLNALYNFTRGESNIDLYDYNQHLYTVGVELKF